MVLRDLRRSRSLAGGGGREDEFEPRPVFVSIEGRGFSVAKFVDEIASGTSGRSGAAASY